jgi:hypothetical protein
VNAVTSEASGKKHAKDKGSELGLGAQKNTRGQPVEN